jgi:hypothetical protein
MPDTKISALPPVVAPSNGDEFAVNQSGVSKKVSLSQLSTFLVAAGPTGATGATGVPANRWFAGAGVPSDLDGNDDDFYLNVTNGDVYQKAGGTWF